MTASPDRPSITPRFVVDTLAINPLKTRDNPATPGRVASGPIRIWDLTPKPTGPSGALTPSVHLSVWPHPAIRALRAVPTITDLVRFLDSGRWRFDLEHLPPEVGEFFGQVPAAQGWQVDAWLSPELHLPAGWAQEQRAAGKAPGSPKVMLFDVLGPDHLPEDSEHGTETLSGVAESFADRPTGPVLVDLSSPDLAVSQGKVFISSAAPPPAGLYDSWGDLDRSWVRS